MLVNGLAITHNKKSDNHTPILKAKDEFLMRDFSRLDGFLNGLTGDIYPEAPSEPHLSITKSAIETLHRDGIIQPGMRVLDIGCGQGIALEHFRNLGLDALGITLGPDGQTCRDKGFDVREMDQNFADFEDSAFDFLWCRHVLEHSIMPFFTMSEYYRLTKPGGHVYVEVPAPDTSAHHETNHNHYSVLPLSLWVQLFQRSKFFVKTCQEVHFEALCGPDVYWSFLLHPQK